MERNIIVWAWNTIAWKPNVISRERNVIAWKPNVIAWKRNTIAWERKFISRQRNIIARERNIILRERNNISWERNAYYVGMKCISWEANHYIYLNVPSRAPYKILHMQQIENMHVLKKVITKYGSSKGKGRWEIGRNYGGIHKSWSLKTY